MCNFTCACGYTCSVSICKLILYIYPISDRARAFATVCQQIGGRLSISRAQGVFKSRVYYIFALYLREVVELKLMKVREINVGV